MPALRSLLYAAIFYPGTLLWVLTAMGASVIGQKPTLKVVLSWANFHNWLAWHILGIRLQVEGEVPAAVASAAV